MRLLRRFAPDVSTVFGKLPSMQTKPLGNSDLLITPLGVGAWAMGGRRMGVRVGAAG